jgi:malonyl-CoA/methylmalonyl-CoA synthetase
MLLPALDDPPVDTFVRVHDRSMSYAELAAASRQVAAQLTPGARVALVAERRIETVIGVAGVLAAGAVVVPVNPAAADRELLHQITDSVPTVVVLPADSAPPPALAGTALVRVHPDPPAGTAPLPPLDGSAVSDDDPALVMYTSGTTGSPKGVVLSRAALAANLDALAAAWAWTADDVLVHALPLYHVHGLVLGVLGALRVGSGLHHLGPFDPSTTAEALAGGGTLHFGVPTIYHRLAEAGEHRSEVRAALTRARLLVSGSAGLPRSVHDRIHAMSGHVIVERYGMTETMITTAVPAGTRDRPGTVGPPLPGVQLRLVDDDGADVPFDGESMGELLVRSPSMFAGYLNRPDATEAAFRDGWFVTGDVATVDPDGFVRIVGRRSTDIIKSGGYKIGAGEIEDVLLGHPEVAEAAVAGRPDDDLGERVTAWVVPRPGGTVDEDELRDHAAALLAPHKRPRTFHITTELPRNALGKVQKSRLTVPGGAEINLAAERPVPS